jgi:NodT family efflux transporter outer membrane factor (OMF) lipoprotein
MSHMKTAGISASILALALASCTVGPNYTPPQTPVAPAYANLSTTQPAGATTRTSTVTTDADPTIQWWTTLRDPELDSLVDRAVTGNIELQEAASRVRQSRAELTMTGARELPTVSAAPAYAHLDAGKHVSLGGGSGAFVADVYQLGFDSSWEIDVFGGQRRQIEAAAADHDARIEDRREVQVSLSAEVARDYLVFRGSQERLRIARENLALQEDTLALTRSLQGNGFTSDLDVTRANTQVFQTRAQIVPLTTLISQQEHAIAILLGLDPNSVVTELDKPASIPNLPATVAVGLPSDLLCRRPDLRKAERQIVAANARIGVAVADYYPKFSLTGDFGLDSNRLSPLFDIDSRFFIIYPTMQWKLFDAGHTKAEVEEQKELYAQAVLAYKSSVLGALRDVEDALVAYNNEQDHRAELMQAVDSARDSVDISRDLYKQGLTDFLQVLDAQRQLLGAQDDLAQSNQAIATNLVALYKALGGGWELDAIHEMEKNQHGREAEDDAAPTASPTTAPSTQPTTRWQK